MDQSRKFGTDALSFHFEWAVSGSLSRFSVLQIAIGSEKEVRCDNEQSLSTFAPSCLVPRNCPIAVCVFGYRWQIGASSALALQHLTGDT